MIAALFGGCFGALRIRLFQTGILLHKNIMMTLHRIMYTLMRLILPSTIIMGLYLLNHSLMGQIKTNLLHTLPGTSSGPKGERFGNQRLLYGPVSTIAGDWGAEVMEDVFDSVRQLANNNKLSIRRWDDTVPLDRCKENICPFNTKKHLENIIEDGKIQTIGGIFFCSKSQSYNTFCVPPDVMEKEQITISVFSNSTKIGKNALFMDSFLQNDQPFNYQVTLAEELIKGMAESQTATSMNFEWNLEPTLKAVEMGSLFPTDFVEQLFMSGMLFVSLFLGLIYVMYQMNDERSNQHRDAMKLAGLKTSSYWVSHFVTQLLILFLMTMGILVIGYSTQMTFFSKTNPIVMFLIIYLGGASMLSMFFCCSVCIRSNRLTNVAGFLYLVLGMTSLLPFATMLNIRPMLFQKSMAIPDPGYALPLLIYNTKASTPLNVFPLWNFGKVVADVTYMTSRVLDIEHGRWVDGPGYSFGDLTHHIYGTQNRTMPTDSASEVPTTGMSLFFLFLSIPGFWLMTWYFDAVLPHSKGGRRYSPCFCITPSYWGFVSKKDNLAVDAEAHSDKNFAHVLPDTDPDIFQEYQATMNSFESDPDNTQVPVKIVKLSKTYTSLLELGKNKNALDSITLSIERGSCLCLLGANGSGKTTMTSMMNGLVKPSSGDVLIFGRSITYNMDSIRRMMGVCLQHEIIFPELTGYGHMRLFCILKGIPLTKIKKEIKEKMGWVDLWEYRNQKAQTYSGGMKRKLAVAIACIGDPKILFLDEPTAQIDPTSRNHIFSLITKLKKDRVIILCTHSMFEADSLGDKIAILALGRLRAVGSSYHLKKRYGAGHSVDITTESPEEFKEKMFEMLPTAKLETEANHQLTYILPNQMSSPPVLNFFSYLEEEAKKQGLVQAFTLAHTTLEEIFLRVTHKGIVPAITTEQSETDNSFFSGGMQQLNVTIEGGSEPIGCIDVDSNTNLQQARQLIRQFIDGAPAHFTFLSHGVELGLKQERLKFALQYHPLLVIKPSDNIIQEEPEPQPDQLTNPEQIYHATMIAKLQEQNRLLMEQIKKQSESIDRIEMMEETIKRLQEENQRLQQQQQ